MVTMDDVLLRPKTKTREETKDIRRTQNGVANSSPVFSIDNLINSDVADNSDRDQPQVEGCMPHVPKFSLHKDTVIKDEEKHSESSDSDSSDDTLVIDLVMASNTGKLSSTRNTSRGNNAIRSKNRSKTMPRKTIKKRSPKTKRRKEPSPIARQPTKPVYSDSDDSVDEDSDEETISRSTPIQPVSGLALAWTAFENVVKSIDNTNPEWFLKKPKPNTESSAIYQEVMVDMYGITDYGNTEECTVSQGIARSTPMASRMANSIIANENNEHKHEEQEQLCESNEEDSDKTQGERLQQSKGSARRNLNKIKIEKDKLDLKYTLQSTKPNEPVLQDNARQMSDIEKTRRDLYERYGIIPTKLPNGKIVCENQMLSQQSRTRLYGSGRKSYFSRYESIRPSSHYPVPVNIRSKTLLSMNVSNQRGTGQSPEDAISTHIGVRPKTAK